MLSKGYAYERLAMDYLKSKGLVSITNNFRCRFGEIDLIMKDKNTLVFVEVKFRTQTNFGDASETITTTKQSKLIKTANLYLSQKKLWNQPCRFDVVSVTKKPFNEKEEINWIQAAFYAA